MIKQLDSDIKGAKGKISEREKRHWKNKNTEINQKIKK